MNVFSLLISLIYLFQDMDVCHKSDARCNGVNVYDDNFDLSSQRVQKSLLVKASFINQFHTQDHLNPPDKSGGNHVVYRARMSFINSCNCLLRRWITIIEIACVMTGESWRGKGYGTLMAISHKEQSSRVGQMHFANILLPISIISSQWCVRMWAVFPCA